MYVLTDTGNLAGTGGTLSLYQDDGATPIRTLNYTGSTASPAGKPFVIGKGGGGTPYYAHAIIDDVAVFNRVLAPSEMAWVHAAGSVSTAMTEMDTYRPPEAKFSWLFDGNANARSGDIDGTPHGYGVPEVLPTYGSANAALPLSYSANQYIQFDAGDQYVDFGNDSELQITEAITVSLWVNPESMTGTRFILGKYGGSERSWAIGTFSSGSDRVLRLMLSKDGSWTSTTGKDYRSTQSIADDEWHHVAFTFADNEARLYLDGVELTTTNDTLVKSTDGAFDALNNSTYNLTAGMRSDALSTCYYKGLLDEVAIWDSVLTAEQVYWLYRSSIYTVPEPSTLAMLLAAIAALAWSRRGRRLR